MTCAAPERELLPFLAAGALGDDERRAAVAHASGCSDCREELRAGRQLAEGLRSLHLTADEVVDAAWSGARPPHLAECPRCAADVDAITRVNAELDAASPPRARSRPAGAWLPWVGMAAALVASVGLGLRVNGLARENGRLSVAAAAARQAEQERDGARRENTALRDELDRAARPQVNAPVVNLEPAGATRGGTAGAPAEVPARAAFATLVLHVVEDRPQRAFTAEIVDGQGRSVWKGDGLMKDAFGTLTLGVPLRLLPAGVYHVRLLSAAGGKETPVATYVFHVS
jgi:hypothetical protein